MYAVYPVQVRMSTIWDEVVNPLTTSKCTVLDGNSVFNLCDVLQECIPGVKRDLPVFAISWRPVSFVASVTWLQWQYVRKKIAKSDGQLRHVSFRSHGTTRLPLDGRLWNWYVTIFGRVTGTLQENKDLYTCMMSRRILRMRNISDKICRENHNTYYVQ
jgi:hypothetical protein